MKCRRRLPGGVLVTLLLAATPAHAAPPLLSADASQPDIASTRGGVV